MSELIFENIKSLSADTASKGLFIWVWHADKVPPHIGISLDGRYYSLKVSGKDQKLPHGKVAELIFRKSIPSLLIELRSELDIATLEASYAAYGYATSGRSTCLSPIKGVLGVPHANRLAELLENLQQSGQIVGVYGACLPDGFKSLTPYGTEDIEQRLSKLQDATRKKYTTQNG